MFFCDLARGQLGQRSEDQLCFAHMVTQVLAFEALDGFVFFHIDARPFLVDDVGEDGKFLAFLDVVSAPVVGELVACLLARHALLYPLVAAAVLLPRLARSVQ